MMEQVYRGKTKTWVASLERFRAADPLPILTDWSCAANIKAAPNGRKPSQAAAVIGQMTINSDPATRSFKITTPQAFTTNQANGVYCFQPFLTPNAGGDAIPLPITFFEIVDGV